MNCSKAELLRAIAIELSRRSFWDYCQTIAPSFYKDDRPHLKALCEVLQNIYEGKLIHNSKVCKRLMINMPPQHGKSRTLINFATWVFGRNPNEKIITASYNDLTASDFSRYTRDAICAKKNLPEEIIYSDVFPGTKIKQGNAGHERWALEGQHFSYIGAGVGGSITSKGGTILMVDDPIKGAEEALNENVLEKTWLWYTSTFLSRVSADAGEPIEIINMTRWSKGDPCGRILEDDVNSKSWYVLKMEAYNKETDQMLCPPMLSKDRYLYLKGIMDDGIFNSNYHQEPLDEEGALFPAKGLHYFEPTEVLEKSFEGSFCAVDVADEGDDNLSAPLGKTVGQSVYIADLVFNRLNMDHTIPLVSGMLIKNKVKYVRIESNAMGAPYGREVRKLCPQSYIQIINSRANKHTRILMAQKFINTHCYFLKPELQSQEYRKFFKELTSYLKEVKKQQHDDAPDSMAMLADYISKINSHLY